MNIQISSFSQKSLNTYGEYKKIEKVQKLKLLFCNKSPYR